MRRRSFVAGLVAGAAFPPTPSALAQQTRGVRKVGIMMPYPASDREVQDRVGAFRRELEKHGWRAGENLQFDERWATDDMARVRAAAAELVAAKPDVILATGARVMPVLQQHTRTVPVVFVATSDPVGRGLVTSLARPGGNMTGFALSELPIVEKLLDMLKQIAPGVRRVALIFNPDNPASGANIKAFNDAAVKFFVQPIITPIRQPADIEAGIEAMAREPNGGAVFPSDLSILAQRDLVVAAAARHGVPAVYADSAMVAGGGLISFSADRKDMFRSSAAYVDRILRGESPAELPVQQPTKYELVVNLKTAQKLGLKVSPALLLQADEVIE